MPCEPGPLKTRVTLVADLFCGAGGSSTGFDFGLQKINFNETPTPLDTAPGGGFVLPRTPPPRTRPTIRWA